MRPTLDGLNSDQWFALARIGATCLLAGTLLWFAGRLVVRGFRHLRELRRQERERERREARERVAMRRYLTERSQGLVSDTPSPWPFLNDNQEHPRGR